jgi:glycosyltransferase involved in cell wall biosynthesis
MNVAIAVIRPFHAVQIANALRLHQADVSILSSAPRSYFHGLAPEVPVRLIPAPVPILQRILPLRLPDAAPRYGIVAWDRMVAASLPPADLVLGFATQSLATGRKARRRGSRFLLDRACPHVDFQQNIIREEAEKVGAKYRPEPSWYRDRQLEEYDLAEVILTPSRYSARTFPPALQSKIVIAPLLGRVQAALATPSTPHDKFTVGVLGGNPLRKGYLYLLEAWKQLALPNARLLLRVGDDFSRFPRLTELLHQLPNVEIIRYVPNIADFYRRCDVFCLPSVDDGFGMALCEAMAHGVASIATQNCGASELLTNGTDGLIVPPRNSESLAEVIHHLYRDPRLRHKLAEAGQQRIQQATRNALYEKALWSAVSPTVNPSETWVSPT